MDSYVGVQKNIHVAIEGNSGTCSSDMQNFVSYMLGYKKNFVPPITSSLWIAKSTTSDSEFFDKKHIRKIAKARQEYKNGKVISEKELFKKIDRFIKENE